MLRGIVRGLAFVVACALSLTLVSCASGDRPSREPSAGGAPGGPKALRTGSVPVSIVTDGEFFVECRVKTGDPTTIRQVSRLKARRLATPPLPGYSIMVAQNRAGNLSTWTPNFATRPAPLVKDVNETTTEMAIQMPDTGTIVVNGTAPIIQVRRVTISSESTRYVVETDGNGWLLKVLDAPDGPVLVDFGIPGQRPTPFQTGACVRCDFNATSPTQITPGDATACTDLTNYANDIINGTF